MFDIFVIYGHILKDCCDYRPSRHEQTPPARVYLFCDFLFEGFAVRECRICPLMSATIFVCKTAPENAGK